MRYAAVVFDLFGTLIEEGADAYLAMMRQTAGLLDAPLDRLYAATAADAEARTVGAYESVEQQFDVLYERLGVAPDAERRAAAVRAYMDAQWSRLVPRDGVLDTLRRLGELGLKRGLISNASQAIVDLWPHTAFPPYFENATLSAAVKTAKPGPAIYRMCCESLDVAPEDCLYVGDGGSDELTGAARVGMHAVLIVPGYDDPTAIGNTRQAWDGDAITSIRDVLGFVEG